MDLLKDYLPLLTILITVVLGVTNLVYTISRDRREVRKEKAERLQLELKQHEKGAYLPRRDKHQR